MPPSCCDMPPRGHTPTAVPSLALREWVLQDPGVGASPTGADRSPGGRGVTDLTEGQVQAARLRTVGRRPREPMCLQAHTVHQSLHPCARVCAHTQFRDPFWGSRGPSHVP